MRIDDDDDLTTPFRVLLDDATVARLMAVADDCHQRPEVILASIIRDVLEDDERAHDEPNQILLQ